MWKSIPLVEKAASAGILEANAKRDVKYTAHIMLSAANPAAKTEGVTPKYSETAT